MSHAYSKSPQVSLERVTAKLRAQLISGFQARVTGDEAPSQVKAAFVFKPVSTDPTWRELLKAVNDPNDPVSYPMIAPFFLGKTGVIAPDTDFKNLVDQPDVLGVIAIPASVRQGERPRVVFEDKLQELAGAFPQFLAATVQTQDVER